VILQAGHKRIRGAFGEQGRGNPPLLSIETDPTRQKPSDPTTCLLWP
jgi:hypothetical protein